METLKKKWDRGETTLGGWLGVPSGVSAEAAGRAGFDYVCVDAQHGAVDYSDAVSMIQAALLGGTSTIVRVPWNERGIIGKMLDAGAHGVIVPMVNTAAEAEAAVTSVRYAPRGARSYGPTVAGMRVDGPYVEWAEQNIAVIPMIETAEAVANLDEILAVDGIDAVYVGPADLSLTLGLPPQNNDGEPAFDDALQAIVAACQKVGVVPGIHANGALTPQRTGQGFRMVTVTADLVAMKLGFASEIAHAKSDGSAPPSGTLY